MAKKVCIAERVEKLLEPVMTENGFELVDVEFIKEGANYFLRVYIDKPGGVTIDDCELVSRALEARLDEEDFIEQAYVLEVSSPGLDRQLKKDKDFVKYAGSLVDVKLYRERDGSRAFQGRLKSMAEGKLCIVLEDETEMEFDKKEIASVRLAVTF